MEARDTRAQKACQAKIKEAGIHLYSNTMFRGARRVGRHGRRCECVAPAASARRMLHAQTPANYWPHRPRHTTIICLIVPKALYLPRLPYLVSEHVRHAVSKASEAQHS